MEKLIKLSKLLPNYAEIQCICLEEDEANYIFKLTTANMLDIQHNPANLEEPATEEASYLVQCLVDKYWERINTGHFSEVSLEIRKVYAIANLYKIFYNLFESTHAQQLEKCSEMLDDAMLVGCCSDLSAQSDVLQKELMNYFDAMLANASTLKLPVIAPLPRQSLRCDIPQMQCPAVDVFRREYFERLQPALLLDTIAHWPALHKWRDLNYLLRTAGNRRVPIEIGSNYVNEEWSQQMMKIRDFLSRQFSPLKTSNTTPSIEYLAQHELFDQIPALKADICLPDYCASTSTTAASENSVDIKAWLGPSGTISPLHFDPKHNLLCQVFGSKRIILAAPDDSANLYAHDTEFLCNTSQIDAEHLDVTQYPLLENVKFYHLTLQEGDCLYMPPKWWHYVRSLSESFSVSFWWE